MTNLEPGRPVVVGVDGSEDSIAAAELAAGEATLRRSALEIVHGYVSPVVGPPLDLEPAMVEPELREQAEQLLHEAAARVRAGHPELAMITRLRDGYPAAVLTDASRQAAVVVVGHRGSGGFADLLAGSVAIQLANHAACPVIVSRGRAAEAAPVVVGVDGSEGSRRAAGFAVEAAARYGSPLVALYAWSTSAGWPPAQAQEGYPPPDVPDAVAANLSALSDTHPQVPVRPEVRQHVAAHEALVAASKNARLVVVGSRGRGGFRGLLLGSVSQALIHHSGCPVAVVGPAAE